VLVSFEGETKVIDFGIAKSAMRGTATDPKVGFGKFGYMAPEQLIRGGVVDHRTDIYAAGVVLFELLTGTRLYEAGPEPDYRALAKKVARGEHQLPSEIDSVLAPYDDLVATALRPKPDDRYQSAAELRDAIQQCLVAVNPTISTDQLGAYMRVVFADEMTAQRELHERVASAHLADFQEQLYTQTIDTVSFAVAQLPLPAPEATGRHARRASTQPGRPRTGPNPTVGNRTTGPVATGRPRTGPNPVTRNRITGPNPTLAAPASFDHVHVPPVGAPVTLDPRDAADLPDASYALEPHGAPGAPDSADSLSALEVALPDLGDEDRTTAVRRRHRALVVASSAVIVLLAVFGLWGVAMTDDAKPPRSQVHTAPARPPAIIVEPIPVAPHPAVAEPGERSESPARSIEMTPDEPTHKARAKSAAAAPPAKAPRALAHKDMRPVTPSPSPMSRELLGQKFQQVRREYDDYKSKFGSRLEREWGELATFIQYMPGSDDDAGRREAARRLDTFRGRMRE
jgi:hypothetical protein